MKIKTGILALLFMSNVLAGETINMQILTSQPILDGDGSDWSAVQAISIPLKKTKPNSEIAIDSILIKGGVYADLACFYLEWQDATSDIIHKPWTWDQKKKKYEKGEQREDRLAIQFAISGEYTTDWLSGKEFTADMWHWKASRSNPLGLAHDKSTTISSKKLLRAYKGIDHADKPIYISRPSDSGDQLYKTKRYRAYQKDLMPKYILNESVQGSVTDVKAKGHWSDGKWHLELCRRFDTGNPDDVVFKKGQIALGGVAVFDHSDNKDHVFSDTLIFQF